MYVFLRDILCVFTWRQFSKSWTPSFLPYPCSLVKFILMLFLNYHKQHQNKLKRYQPLCVSFYYIIYIVNVCIFEYTIFTDFHWCQFSKSWTPSFLPYPCSESFRCCVFRFSISTNNNEMNLDVTNPCVFLFIMLYIYSKCMYFWVKDFIYFCWRQFSKSWTPSFLPYPCSLMPACRGIFCLCSTNIPRQAVIRCTNPCVFLFIILYY